MSQETNPVIAQFAALRAAFSDLESRASLKVLSSKLEEITLDVEGLPEQIATVRSRGYVFAAYLEQKADVLKRRWNTARIDLSRLIDSESDQLRATVDRIRIRITQADRMASSPDSLSKSVPGLAADIGQLETAVDDVEERAREIYTTLDSDIGQTIDQLEKIRWVLDMRDEASFKFLEGEALFLAATAEWQSGKDDPDGILYLTDQRLIFEQKETTGKKLGLFGGKKTQELEWEIPLHKIEGVTAENKGLFGGKDLLHFTFGGGAPIGNTTVEVKGGVACKFWAAQITRMTSGDVQDERAIQPEPEVLEAIRNAPTACPSCSGTLPRITAAERQITCEYCGTTIRL